MFCGSNVQIGISVRAAYGSDKASRSVRILCGRFGNETNRIQHLVWKSHGASPRQQHTTVQGRRKCTRAASTTFVVLRTARNGFALDQQWSYQFRVNLLVCERAKPSKAPIENARFRADISGLRFVAYSSDRNIHRIGCGRQR